MWTKPETMLSRFCPLLLILSSCNFCRSCMSNYYTQSTTPVIFKTTTTFPSSSTDSAKVTDYPDYQNKLVIEKNMPEIEQSTTASFIDKESTIVSLFCVAALIIAAGGAILMMKISKKLNNRLIPSCDQQITMGNDSSNFIQSSSCLVETNPVGHIYENVSLESGHINENLDENVILSTKKCQEKIIHPVYATVEFLPRCSVTEEMARTFPCGKAYLDGDPIIYAEIEMKKF